MNDTPPPMTEYQDKLTVRSRLARMLWNLTYALLFRPTPRIGFFGWRRFLLRLFGAKLAHNVRIYPKCRVWAPWNLDFAPHVTLADDVDCYSVDVIRIGERTTVSQGAFLCAASHDFSSPGFELITRPISIGAWSWVAARAFVGPGVTLGEGSVVGACAVVTRDVAPWTVVAGNPAKPVKERAIRNLPEESISNTDRRSPDSGGDGPVSEKGENPDHQDRDQ